MTRSLTFGVIGLPAPQGSKRHVGRGVMIESSKGVKPWRQDVAAAAAQAIAMASHFKAFATPVKVRATFTFPRPKSHYGTGRNANILKPNAPHYVGKKPDIDKVLRSTFDALSTAGVWRDDDLAVDVKAVKVYGPQAGAHLHIEELQP